MTPRTGLHGRAARLEWYRRRLGQMSPAEVTWRVGTRVRQEVWAHRRFGTPATVWSATGRSGGPRPGSPSVPHLPRGVAPSDVPLAARRALLACADELLAGRATVLGCLRTDMGDPTWALDPRSGRTFPRARASCRIDLHAPGDPRQVKHVWELSRHHHLSVLGAAWWLSGEERYAACVARQLRSWWAQNPVFTGVNWTSGIELGIRLLSWVWIRRLLGEWPGVSELFERNPTAVTQIYWHQRWLEAFFSRGSSANNHVVAEAAGWLGASCAFPWFHESARWQARARSLFEHELGRNVFSDGVDREQAFDYHGLVAELAIAAATEAKVAGVALASSTWEIVCRMLDVVAAVLDCAGGAPRDGDGDDGRGLVLDAPGGNRWMSLLATGEVLFGAAPWWRRAPQDLRSTIMRSLVTGAIAVPRRPETRPSHFSSAGMTILRSTADAKEELWCRCDGGAHGYLSIAAHGHADALSIELRHDGVEILADPGTYCYHGEPRWRRYFRSTLAHNTIELDGADQSVSGGPFLWVRHARTEVLEVAVDETGPKHWSALHHGYDHLGGTAQHWRRVVLDPEARSLVVVDRLRTDRPRTLRLAFHLGPAVEVALEGHWATLRWTLPSGQRAAGTLLLPAGLRWERHRAEIDPPLGWYSPGFGRKVPSVTLLGTGKVLPPGTDLRSELRVRVPDPAHADLRGTDARSVGVGG